jgi:hypothetical protein
MKRRARRSSTVIVLVALVTSCGYFDASLPAAACGAPRPSVEEVMRGAQITEDMLPCSSGQPAGRTGPSEQQLRQQQERQEQQERWREASQLNSEANEIADRGDYARAMPLYERALDLFRANGDRQNMAITQRNLDITRKQYAAIKDDNRVNAARTQFANQDIYKDKGNPFAASPPQYSGQSQSASCSTITGLGGDTPAATSCNTGNAALAQAQKLYQQDRAAARTKYQEAADAYRRAGDIARANAILAEAQRVFASLESNPLSQSPAAAPSQTLPTTPPVRSSSPSPRAAPSDTASRDADRAVPAPRVSPQAIVDEAAKLCSYAPAGSADRKQCMLREEAQLIMNSDPDIKAACGVAQSAPARDDCALKMYAEQVARQRAAQAGGHDNCYFDKLGQPCIPGGGGAASASNPPGESLRDRLRRSLENDKAARGDTSRVDDEQVDAAAKTQPQSNAAVQPGPAPGSANADDPLQNYLQSQNGNSGGLNNGTLTSRDPNFSMSGSQTQNEVKRLQQDPDAYGPPVPGENPPSRARP